jgi:hypothetical protein
MEGHDHSECPIELRACPHHASGAAAEAEPDGIQIDFSMLSDDRQQTRPICRCGCDDTLPSVAFCIWCDHVYADFSPLTEDQHFAHHCSEAPEELRSAASARSTKRNS